MSESAKVRLVRCPKCEKLLPEVTEFSVYQCGGCGAVLKAKNKGVDLDTFSEKSDDERIGGTIEKLSDRYEKMMNVSERMSDCSDSDVRSTISSSSRAEQRRILRENNRTSLPIKDEKWDPDADPIQDNNIRPSRTAQDYENLAMYHDNDNGLRRSGRMGYEEEEGFLRARRMDPKVGPSRPVSRSSYDYENPARSTRNVDVSNNVEYIGEDRAELLRKLDELKDHLSRSGDLADKGKEKIPLDPRMPPHDPYAYENWYSDAQFKRPVYQNQYPEPPPSRLHQEVERNGFYHPPRYAPNHHPNHPMRPHMHRRASQSHVYTSGSYTDDGMVYMDPMESYPPHYNRHHPSCPCYQCLSKRRISTAYSDKFSNVPNDMIHNYHNAPGSYNQRVSNPPSLRSHSRWPSDVNSEVDGYVLRRPPRAHLPSSGKNCRPVAGGAPFLACYNCFELLFLSKKVLNKNKLRCGGCSTVIVFTVSNNGLVVSHDVEAKDSPVKVEDTAAFSSDNYDNSGYDFHSMDRESGHVSTRDKLEAEEDAEVGRKDSGSADLATEEKAPLPPAGLSLQDYFEYSNKYRLAKDSGEGNRSGRSEHEKLLPNKALRKESSATEIDLSSNEYCNTGTTVDSSEASKEGDRLKASRVAESFFAGIIKKSFKDSQKPKDGFEQEHGNVTVNGHLISDRMIKKAEKLAGTIHPGNYWYDFRAGFWGVIGGPCLGIVPPFIEEFNYPMQEDCAGGNTGVFVNGRELNKKDMNLLGSRGLPMEKDRSYIIEISGRVLDEDTGEELESLGKLAPTVERMKRGFGMRAPKAVA